MTEKNKRSAELLVNNKPPFTIENNVIIGASIPLDASCFDIGATILKIFNEKPKHVAQIEVKSGKETLYEDMRESSLRCALWLQKQNVGFGDVVAVCTENQPDAYIPCIAAFYVGAVFNPWHHEVTLKTARYLMGLTRPKVMFSCVDAVSVLTEAARLEKVDTRFIVFGKYSGMQSLRDAMRLQTNEDVRSFESPTIQPDSIAMILFSSGTTGMPKGVTHSYKSLYRNISSFSVLASKNCISLWYSSLYWISGTFCMLQSLLTQSTRIIHENFDPEETCRVIEKFQVNWFFISPSAISILYKSNILEKYRLKTLKTMLTGGSKLNRDVIEGLRKSLPHTVVAQGFGMTEIGGLATIQTNNCKMSDSAGFVIPSIQLKVIDVASGKILGPNEEGEICLKSSTLMLGYYKNSAATKATIDEQGWLHSGDKGYFSDSGEVVIVDRLKEVMKFRGHQISPHEVEAVLMRHEAVMEVAVVPVPHELDGERPMAFVRKAPGAEVTEAELVELSKRELGEMKKLRAGVRFVEAIPYTASGKISRKELKEMAKLASA